MMESKEDRQAPGLSFPSVYPLHVIQTLTGES